MRGSPTLARTATVLSRNPLGLLALCLVVGEAIASLFLFGAGDLQRSERVLLCVFVVTYPLVVVAAIYRLISHHHTRLYAPTDFRDERCFLEVLQLTGGTATPFVSTRAIVGDDFALIAPQPAANCGQRAEPGFYGFRDDEYYVTRRGQMFLLRRGGELQPPQELRGLPEGCRRVHRHECDRELRALADAIEIA